MGHRTVSPPPRLPTGALAIAIAGSKITSLDDVPAGTDGSKKERTAVTNAFTTLMKPPAKHVGQVSNCFLNKVNHASVTYRFACSISTPYI